MKEYMYRYHNTVQQNKTFQTMPIDTKVYYKVAATYPCYFVILPIKLMVYLALNTVNCMTMQYFKYDIEII